jgi:hypothetical protein
LRCKTFDDHASGGMERAINEWLAANLEIKVHHTIQSSAGVHLSEDAGEVLMTAITIFYE